MTRSTRRGRRRLPALTRKQCRARVRAADHQLAGADRLIADQRARIKELEEENARLRAERVDAGVLAQQLGAAEATNAVLNTELLSTRAALQNATSIDVPPMVRDTDEHPTEPIYVQTLRDEMATREAARTTPQVRPLADALGGQR